MAVLAGCGEELRLRGVARIGRVVVIGLMATNAGRRQRRVIVVDVAIGALPRRRRVRTGQRECGLVVIEGRIRPHRSVVAEFALLGEPGRYVVRIRSPLEILQMARYAGGTVQGIVVVDVAVGAQARRRDVGAGQGEAG